MSSYYPDEKQVRIPVKRVGDAWEFFYGGGIPVKDGALGELIVGANQVTDARFLERMTGETSVRIFDEGSLLLVALSDRSQKGGRIGQWPNIDRELVPHGTTRFEAIVVAPLPASIVKQPQLRGVQKESGVWLRLKGLERSELVCRAVRLPDELESRIATSLNHAYTLLSEKYETHRISHTGNVYSRIFYEESNGKWYPLADLRDGVRVEAERQLIAAAWQEVEEKLGWRPIRPEK